MTPGVKHGDQKRKKVRAKKADMNVKVGIWCRTGSSMICLPHTSAVCSGFHTRAAHTVPQDCISRTKDPNDFLSWLRKKAGVEVCSSLIVGMSSHGRSLFASGTIHAGECIMRIPHNLLITPDKLQAEVEPLLGKDASNYARLALFILAEQKLGKTSEWAPYIHRLPQMGNLNSTIFWSEEELEMIQQSSVHRETVNRKASIKKEFDAVQQVGFYSLVDSFFTSLVLNLVPFRSKWFVVGVEKFVVRPNFLTSIWDISSLLKELGHMIHRSCLGVLYPFEEVNCSNTDELSMHTIFHST